MTAIIGFDSSTGAYKFAVSTTDEKILRQKRVTEGVDIVELAVIPKYVHLYEYINGKAVQLGNYAAEAAILDTIETAQKYKQLVSKKQFRKLLLLEERVLYDKLEHNIEGDLSFLPSSSVDVPIAGKAGGLTNRDQVRTMFIDMNMFEIIDVAVDASSVQLLRDLGVLATDDRVGVLLLGSPI